MSLKLLVGNISAACTVGIYLVMHKCHSSEVFQLLTQEWFCCPLQSKTGWLGLVSLLGCP